MNLSKEVLLNTMRSQILKEKNFDFLCLSFSTATNGNLVKKLGSHWKEDTIKRQQERERERGYAH